MTGEILVIREKDVFSSILTEQGFSVINFPVIKTEPLADLSELESCLAKIESFDGIFITSVKAAEIVSAKLREMRVTCHSKFFVLGKRSANLLKEAGYNFFFSESATTVEELLQIIPKQELENRCFLFPRGNRSLRIVPDALVNCAEVVETIVYETVSLETDEKKLIEIHEKFRCEEIAAVCFFSPSSVDGFLQRVEDFSQFEIKIAAIGKTTARRVEENNLQVYFVSTKPTANDFAFGLVKCLRGKI